MNTIFDQRRNLIDRAQYLKMKIRLVKSQLANLERQEKALKDENYNLISIHTAPIVFYFGRTKNVSSIDEEYTGYFYNYISGSIIYRLDNFIKTADNIIDVCEFFKDVPLTSENIRKIKENINTYIDYLRVRHNPESWEELFKLIRKHLYKDEVQKILTNRQ